MKNERQIELFLKKNTSFNQTQIAAKLNEKFSELGNPVILPPNDKNPNQPLIIFNQGLLNLTLNYNDVSFVFFEENKDKVEELMYEIITMLEDYSLDFVRFGYVSTYLGTKKEKEIFKEKVFKIDNMINDDFQLSWYTKELIDSVSVNVWERHFTDFANNVELVSIFDINTPMEEEFNITSDFIENFIKKCDKHINKKMNEIK